MIIYLLKMIGCSLVLLLVYLLLLQKEKMYRFNRFYLLFSIAFAFLAPLIAIRVSTPTPLALVTENLPAITDDLIAIQPAQAAVAEETVNLWPIVLIALYATITAFLLCRFIINLITLSRKIRKGSLVAHGNATLVLTDKAITPYSFLSYIFLNKQDFDNGIVEKEILRHELTHVKQLHSWDILLTESLLIFCWVNPFLFLYRKAIQLNHEFLADESVIDAFHDTPSYQYLLFNKLSSKSNALLTSSFNYLITKKRLTMMNKQSNRTVVLAKQVALLPLLAGMVFLFSTKVYAQQPAQVKPAPKTAQKEQASDKKELPPPMVTRAALSKIPEGPGATAEQLATYDDQVKNMTSTRTGRNGKTHSVIDLKGVNMKDMAAIYKQMNGEQRSARNQTTGNVLVNLTTPPKKNPPTTAQLQAWTDAAKYGVWIDNKRITNSDLQSHQPSDFALYDESKLAKNAVNYGKHYYQVTLYTAAHYKKTFIDPYQ